jgi:hypothetical protein
MLGEKYETSANEVDALKSDLPEYFGAYLSNRLDTRAGFLLRIKEVMVDWAEQWTKENDPKRKDWLSQKTALVMGIAHKAAEEDVYAAYNWLADTDKYEFRGRDAFELNLVKIDACRKKLATEWAKRQAEDEAIRKEYQDTVRQTEEQERLKGPAPPPRPGGAASGAETAPDDDDATNEPALEKRPEPEPEKPL